MKKIGWNIFFTLFFCCILLVCFIVKKQDSFQPEEITDSLTFILPDNSGYGNEERIRCWKQDENFCVVFLPSYANLDEISVHLDSAEAIYLDDILLVEGMNCNSFELDKEYKLTSKSFAPINLKFSQSANVSSMFISTSHNNLTDINSDKSLREHVNISLRGADGHVNYLTHAYDDLIRGHGNSTWKYEKKPYNLYLDKSTSLLNMSSAKEWVLLANALDATNLRNKIVYDYIRDVSEQQIAPECDYVELFVDGEYLGLYLLCEKLQNVSDRYMGNNDYTEVCQNNAITKVDYPEVAIQFKDGSYFEIVDSEKYSVEASQQLEKFLYMVDQNLTGEHWSDNIDIPSFAAKYLIEEIFSNIDGASASQYYFWDKENSRLYSGSCWDYDLTMGDTTWVEWISPSNLYVQNGLWYNDIFRHEEFTDYYKELYKEKFLPVINTYIDSKIIDTFNTIEKASSNNYIRWYSQFEEYGASNDLSQLITFLSKHIDFLNSVWLDGEQYCRISFESNTTLPIVDLYLPVDSSTSLIPSPNEMGLESESEWLYNNTGEALDKESCVTTDLNLYMDGEKAEKVSSTAQYSSGNNKIIKLSIIILLLFFLVVIIIEYQNNIKKGRLMNG